MIVCFAGFKSSGKSEATRTLLARGFAELKMADPLKDMLRALYSYSNYSLDEIEQRIEGQLKEIEDPFLGSTPRLAMQLLGTEWRDGIGNIELWSQIWSRRASELSSRFRVNIVCSDIRFPHEIAAVRRAGGKTYWINRPGTGPDGHASELDISALCDGIIQNDHDLNALRSRVVMIAAELATGVR